LHETLRKSDESLEHYLLRLGDNKEEYELSWYEIRDLMNSQVEEEYSESKWRKDYTLIKKGYELCLKDKINSDEIIQKINDKSLELQKERIKLQSEKLEYSKMLRESARSELIEEKILKAIENRPSINVPLIYVKPNNRKKDYILPIADIHYGADFTLYGWQDEILNKYNPEIAQKSMWDILEQYISINENDKINHVHVFNLGDSIDGILRMSQLQWIKLGNVDAAIEFAEFMSVWLNELSKYSVVDYYTVMGNHAELRLLNGKRGDFPEENMEKIIAHIIYCNLKNNKNVTIHKCKNHVYQNILGTNVLAVHGHEEKKLVESLLEYPMIYNHPVDLMLAGHLHHEDIKTIGMNGIKNIEYIQTPSIIGIDDFSLKIKKTANPGAILLTIQENYGRSSIHSLKIKRGVYK